MTWNRDFERAGEARKGGICAGGRREGRERSLQMEMRRQRGAERQAGWGASG